MTPTQLEAILAEREACAVTAGKLVRFDRKGADAQQRARADSFQSGQRYAAEQIRNRPTPAIGEVNGWLPIESADLTKSPRKVVDLWVVHTSCTGRLTGERSVNCAYYRESATHAEGWHDQHGNKIEWRVNPDDVDEGNDPNEGRTVTHWRPLPTPPSALARP